MGKQRKERLFRMKRFDVRHSASANKVGVDGVLVGAWSDVPDRGRILDAGTGCGLIALMVAQRSAEGRILAIETDKAAVDEARVNVAESPWSDRIKVEQADFSLLDDKFDLIVSNPPFFHSGVDASAADSSRMTARHAGSLSPEALIIRGPQLLNPCGMLSFIAQSDMEMALLEMATKYGLRLKRLCRVKGHPEAPVKRVLMEFLYPVEMDTERAAGVEESQLIIELEPNVFTPEYTALCRPYYIKIPD